MTGRLSAIRSVAPELLATRELVVETRGEGFTDITRDAARFVEQSGAGDGALLLYLRHTSASLVIQENADPDVQTDLVTALRRLAPDDGPLGAHGRGPRRHAGARQGHADRRVAARSGARRRARARHLAGHLSGRAPRAAAPARGDAAIHRQPA